jgi:hypothetical protein
MEVEVVVVAVVVRLAPAHEQWPEELAVNVTQWRG